MEESKSANGGSKILMFLESPGCGFAWSTTVTVGVTAGSGRKAPLYTGV